MRKECSPFTACMLERFQPSCTHVCKQLASCCSKALFQRKVLLILQTSVMQCSMHNDRCQVLLRTVVIFERKLQA